MNQIRRTIHPETKVLDEKEGLVEYVASDETLDHYREVVKADGWRFNHFKKNAPFANSHRYDSIDDQLGKVVDFRVSKGKLIETVKWAIDVEENKLAQLGFKMTQAGYLKAVSVGFYPIKFVSRFSTGRDFDAFKESVEGLGLNMEDPPDRIFLEHEQIELSAVVLGANPNALARIAKAYKAEILSDSDIESLSAYQFAHDETVESVLKAQADAAAAEHRRRERFLTELEQQLKRLNKCL